MQSLNYQFDALGDLTSRSDVNQNLTETFTYDALNRVTGVNGPVPKTYQYSAIGNIIYKSDVGTYTYGQSGAGPHAVTSTVGALNNVYAYDLNGNMVSGGGRTIAYTSFNKPSQITANGIITNFLYDPNYNRIIKTAPTVQTIYIGKFYERHTSGTLIEHKHHIYAGNQLIALRTERNNGQHDTRYLHIDHLGSIDVITDESGQVVERLSYDAHGKRRQINWLDATGPINSLTHHGYTGHEHDDNAGLINMNARLYDPVLGRFLTPDIIVQAPTDGQSYNRYTYVNNNPLSYTDPTGRSWKKVRGVIKVVVGFVIAVLAEGDPVLMNIGFLFVQSGVRDLNGEEDSTDDFRVSFQYEFGGPSDSSNSSSSNTQSNPTSRDDSLGNDNVGHSDSSDVFVNALNVGPVFLLLGNPNFKLPQSDFITAEQGQRVLEEAKKNWLGTPYLEGGKSREGADCSGITWGIYRAAGFPYEFRNSKTFHEIPNFRPVPGNSPQSGDVGVWKGHMLMYDPSAGEIRKGLQGNAWSAFRDGVAFGPARYQWFEQTYGPVQWYRYYQLPGN